MLADSNLIIYASRPDHPFLRDWFEREAPSVSGVSLVETLGYHLLAEPNVNSWKGSSPWLAYCRSMRPSFNKP